MSRREYEVMFKLSGEMSSAFKNSFKNASAEAKLLQSAMRDVNSQMSDVSKYQKQNRAVREAADSLQLARAEQERLREELSKLDKVTDSNIAQWNKSERAVQAAAEKYLDATAKLKDLQSALEDAGVDTSNVADEAERLKDAYADLEKCKQYITDISSALDDQKAKLQAASSDLAKTAGGFVAAAGTAYALTGEQAKDFETAFAGVQKTVDASAEELQAIREGILDMSQTDVTATAVEIAAVAESAGQLGIETDNILEFSEVIIDLSESTNLAAEQGASDLAKFANITKMSQDNFDELGSTIVDLGNNFATTEADIVSMGIRLASTGELTGLSEAEIMGMATALSSLGIEAEVGGTAASKLLKKFENAFATGAMEEYASVAGMTEEAFSALYSESNLAAINAFVKGLTDEERNGKGAIEILSDLEIKEERLSNAILALASSDDILTKAVDTANKAWEENTALTIEAEKRYATTESRMDMAKNSVENLGIVLGDMMLPLIKEGADDLTEWAMSAQRWVSENQETIKQLADLAVKVGGAVIAFKTMKVAYHGLNTIGLTAVKGVSKVGTAIKATTVAAKGAKLSTFANSLTGLTGTAASFVAVGAGAVTVLAAIAAAVWADHEAVMALRKEFADGQLFENGLPKLEDYTEALKDSTSNTIKFAEEVNATETELQNIAYEMSLARADVELYGSSLRTEATLTPEEAEALKQPFADLVGYLEDDFSVRYTTVFDAFSLAASEVASELGVDIATISSTLDSFKSKYTGSLSESEQVVNDLLTKRSEGGILTTVEMNQLREEMAYVAELSANESVAHDNYEQKAAQIQGMDFGDNKELAIQNIQELTQYGQEYLTEIDTAQQNLNRYYDDLRDDAATMLEYGKITQAEYDAEIQNLNLAQGVTYEAYLANREEFTTELTNTVNTLRTQVDDAVTGAVDASGTNFADNWVGSLGAWGNFLKGKGFSGQADLARSNAINETRKLYDGVIDEINNLSSTAKLDPVYLPIEYEMPKIDMRSGLSATALEAQYKGELALTNTTGEIAQYAVGTHNAARGFALVGEEGPELVQFGGGEKVYTAAETAAMFGDYQSVMIMPHALAVAQAPCVGNFGGSFSIVINSNPVFNAADGDIDHQIEDYGDMLAQKIRGVISDMLEDTRRNAYS